MIEPLQVAIGFALKLGARIGDRVFGRHVVGIVQHQLALVPQPPQQPLLGDLLGDPAERSILHPLGPRARAVVRARLAAQPLLFDTRERFLEVGVERGEPPFGRLVADHVGSASSCSQYSSYRSGATGMTYTSIRDWPAPRSVVGAAAGSAVEESPATGASLPVPMRL